MAEGDTIHRLALRIEAAMGGREIAASGAPSPRSPLHRTAGRLEGLTLETAEARGKHLLIGFDDGLTLRSHLKMNGGWHLYAPGESWSRSERNAWLVLSTGNALAVQFGGPELELIKRTRLEIHPKLARLGPDILGPGFEDAEAVARLRSRPDREIGDAILDQGLVAGVGNIFKSEGLWRAKVDPWRRIGDLGEEELLRVVAETRVLMAAGVKTGRRPRNVYNSAGRPCSRDRTTILARKQGDDARTTYWCPRCQV